MTMHRQKELTGEYNGDLIGFDPEDPGIVI
jgi:hypothetical protein